MKEGLDLAVERIGDVEHGIQKVNISVSSIGLIRRGAADGGFGLQLLSSSLRVDVNYYCPLTVVWIGL